MLENKIAIFGIIFLAFGLVLLFVLFFWLLKRARLVFKAEREKKDYAGLIRSIIFIISVLFIFLAWIFFQMQNQLRPFSEWLHPGQVLSSEKLIAEIRTTQVSDSLFTLSFYIQGKEGKIYVEDFELAGVDKFRLEAEVLYWDKWLNTFGFVDGYKLTHLEIFSSDTLQEKIKTYKLSGGPTQIWKKINGWRKLLFMVKPEKFESEIFVLTLGETKKVYIKDKKIVVE